MPGWRVQMHWWSGWKDVETFDTEEAMTTSLNDWHRRHGKVMQYRGLDPDGKEKTPDEGSCVGAS